MTYNDYIPGTASQGVYMVDYPEVKFNVLFEDELEQYKTQWREAAKAEKCNYLCVRAIPDTLFGDGGPKVVYQEKFDNRPWTLDVTVVAKLHPDTVFSTVRGAMLTRLRIAYGPGTTYKVVSEYAGTVEEGVL
jgi:hypothetical protein